MLIILIGAVLLMTYRNYFEKGVANNSIPNDGRLQRCECLFLVAISCIITKKESDLEIAIEK